MNAEKLPLPEGVDHAMYVDGMREIFFYSIKKDRLFLHWDTLINGEKYFHERCEKPGWNRDAESVTNYRTKAREYFEKIENG